MANGGTSGEELEHDLTEAVVDLASSDRTNLGLVPPGVADPMDFHLGGVVHMQALDRRLPERRVSFPDNSFAEVAIFVAVSVEPH